MLQVPGRGAVFIPPDPADSSPKSGRGEPPTDASMAGIRAVWIIGGSEEQRRCQRGERPRRSRGRDKGGSDESGEQTTADGRSPPADRVSVRQTLACSGYEEW